MKKLKYWIRNYFGFSQRETNGFLVLSALMLLFLLAPSFINSIYPTKDNTTEEDQIILNSIVSQIQKDTAGSFQSSILTEIVDDNVEPLNPNTANLVALKRLFGNKLAKTMIKFREKGGVFKIKSDLRKIYGMNEQLFQKTSPYINLPESIDYPTFQQISKSIQSKPFDINICDSIELEKLRGIGNILASRIIKYRNKLGGFISKEQYKEIYRLDTLALNELKTKTFISNQFIPQKLNINQVTKEQLANHPYIGRKYSEIISMYKREHGPYTSEEDLLKAKIPSEVIKKCMPYITF